MGITCSSESDIVEAFECAEEQNLKSLKLYIIAEDGNDKDNDESILLSNDQQMNEEVAEETESDIDTTELKDAVHVQDNNDKEEVDDDNNAEEEEEEEDTEKDETDKDESEEEQGDEDEDEEEEAP